MYESCIAYVYSTVKRYISNDEDVKDQVQETFAKVFTNIKSFDNEKGTFNSWLRKITVNQCLTFLRKNKSITTLNVVEISEAKDEGEYSILDQLSRKDIETLLNEMPPGYKLIFMLNVIDGYDHNEIQDMLGIKKETSRSQLSRAKKWLKKNLEQQLKTNAYGLL